MDRFKLTIGNFETIVDEKTEVSVVGNKLSVTFNDYTTGKMTRLLTDSNIEMTTLDDVVDKEYIIEVRYHEKRFNKALHFQYRLTKMLNDFAKSIKESADFVYVDTTQEDDEVIISYKDRYPKIYPLKKERDD